MISAAVLELGGSDVDDPLPCTVGNQMYETPGETKSFVFVLGYLENSEDEKWESPGIINKKPADAMLAKYQSDADVDKAFARLNDYVVVHRHKRQHRSFQFVFSACEAAVTDAVAAFVAVQFSLSRTFQFSIHKNKRRRKSL